MGTAKAPSPTTTTRMVTSGTRVTVRTHHPKMPPERSFSPAVLAFVSARDLLGRNLSPMSPMKAGSIVRAMTTARATPMAAKIPMTVRKGILAMDRPMRAMTTVAPAKTTAEPEVATARAADSCTSAPSRSWSRWRDRMNRA